MNINKFQRELLCTIAMNISVFIWRTLVQRLLIFK